jgi:hypothetical protein
MGTWDLLSEIVRDLNRTACPAKRQWLVVADDASIELRRDPLRKARRVNSFTGMSVDEDG